MSKHRFSPRSSLYLLSSLPPSISHRNTATATLPHQPPPLQPFNNPLFSASALLSPSLDLPPQHYNYNPPYKRGECIQLYVPDLLFFGESYTARPERSESFQAQCLIRFMEVHRGKKLSLVGLSYGGFVGYSLAAQFKEVVEKVVICCAGVCLEEKDLRDGLFKVPNLEEAVSILLPQMPDDHPRSFAQIQDIFNGISSVVNPSFRELIFSDHFKSINRLPMTCIITDAMLSYPMGVAIELGIHCLDFHVQSATFLWSMYRFPDMVEAGDLPFTDADMDKLVTSIPGMESYLQCRYLPIFCRGPEPNDVLKINLDLKRGGNGRFLKTAVYGHFGRDDPDFTWEVVKPLK